MEVQILEENENVLKIEVDDLTLVNLLNEKVWKQRGADSAYKIDHPYMAKPVITVRSKNPKKTLIEAADKVIEDVEALRKKLQAALK